MFSGRLYQSIVYDEEVVCFIFMTMCRRGGENWNYQSVRMFFNLREVFIFFLSADLKLARQMKLIVTVDFFQISYGHWCELSHGAP